jgi:glycerophosphoryl diester phosphodiesterase
VRADRDPVFTERPTVIGHRGHGAGLAGDVAENTLSSFAAATDAGLAWIELDVRRTADDRLVVVHDPRPDGGAFVAEQSAQRLAESGVPLFEDVLATLPAHIALDIDVKSSLDDALRPPERTTAGLLAEVLDGHLDGRHVLATSFDPAALLILRGALPWLPLGLLTWFRFPIRKSIAAAAHLGVEVVAAQLASFSLDGEDPGAHDVAHTVDVAHRAGLEVLAWCPGAPQSVALRDAGVDALVVDDVAGVLAALDGVDGPAT